MRDFPKSRLNLKSTNCGSSQKLLLAQLLKGSESFKAELLLRIIAKKSAKILTFNFMRGVGMVRVSAACKYYLP